VLLSLKRINGLSAGNALALIVGLTTVFAAISWHFFEKPLIERYGRTKIPAMTPDAADVSQVEPTRLG